MKKVLAITLSLLLFILIFSSCSGKKDEETTEESTTEYTTEYITETTTVQAETAVSNTTPETTAAETTTAVPATTIPATTEVIATQPVQQDVSTYSKGQIIGLYSAALSKTRSYTAPLTVHHKEDMTFELKEASVGGPLVQRLVNTLMTTFIKPTDSDYSFSGGTAVNEDGENIPLLLPQRNNFELPEDAVLSATAESTSDGGYRVKIVLNDEKVGYGEVPKNNSGAMGYLDTTKLELKIVKINSCTIDYTGSVIDAVIRPDGYIGTVTYTINMTTTANISGMGLSGSGTVGGAQTEIWDIKW